jgi:phage baseplate assembly protein W
MNNVGFLGVGLKFPVSVEDGKIALSKYEEDIKEAIWIILGTARGERVMRPDFGCDIHELVFALNNTATAGMVIYYVQEALINWEPRIEVLNVDADPDAEEGHKLNVSIEYRVRKTNNVFNLVYPFYLERSVE